MASQQLSKVLGLEGSSGFVVDSKTVGEGLSYETLEGEFWTSDQRRGSNLHEVSYRACFKPQLPSFFIERFGQKEGLVYDPFSGRGTTAIEAALLGHEVAANDINPLSTYLTRPRLRVPHLREIEERLSQIPKTTHEKPQLDLSMFYEDNTLQEILALRHYLADKEAQEASDHVDNWIRMVATNRLTGHSPGFFSVYSMPPNQAVSQARQLKINEKRGQVPPYRDTHQLIIKKSGQLQKGLTSVEIGNLMRASETAVFLNSDAAKTPQISDNSVKLIVTSPPFLDVVQYSEDNWLRGWFNSIDMDSVSANITMSRSLQDWSHKMSEVFTELSRVLKPGGVIAFEVGEVRNGKVKLEEAIVPLGVASGLESLGVMINTQAFTKTSNIWGISNNSKGTNSNRIALFRK